jgi:hypothetical protein
MHVNRNHDLLAERWTDLYHVLAGPSDDGLCTGTTEHAAADAATTPWRCEFAGSHPW